MNQEHLNENMDHLGSYNIVAYFCPTLLYTVGLITL